MHFRFRMAALAALCSHGQLAPAAGTGVLPFRVPGCSGTSLPFQAPYLGRHLVVVLLFEHPSRLRISPAKFPTEYLNPQPVKTRKFITTPHHHEHAVLPGAHAGDLHRHHRAGVHPQRASQGAEDRIPRRPRGRDRARFQQHTDRHHGKPCEAKTARGPEHHPGGKVLVMDDEEMLRVLSSQILEHLGYEVTPLRVANQAAGSLFGLLGACRFE